MKIELLSLTLHNFKGAKDLTVNFSHRTKVSGDNATGKTRLFDGFTFCLFGKDSDDKKDFNIKSLDTNNEPLHKQDHSVCLTLSTDGINTIFERTYKEKWETPHGKPEPVFKGHETEYKINNVPHQQKEYNDKVESILSESLFKQITSPAFFNSMKWTERREMLFSIAGGVTDQEVASTSETLKAFYDSITGKDFDLFKRELAAKRKLLKERKADIPARIDEVSRTIIPDPDYGQIEKDITGHSARIHQIDGLLTSAAERYSQVNQKNQERQNKVYELRTKINELHFTDKSKAENSVSEMKDKKNRLTNDIQTYKDDIARFNTIIDQKTKLLSDLEAENTKLRAEWDDINRSSITFDDNEFICPACQRPFETDDIEAKKESMTASFNTSKSQKLARITEAGKANNVQIVQIKADITERQKTLDKAKEGIASIQPALDKIVIPETPEVKPSPEIIKLEAEVKELEAQISPVNHVDNSELITEKTNLNTELDELKGKLKIKELNEKNNTRRQELIDQEKSLAQQIADIERQEFKCEAFTKAKIEMVEGKINSMFRIVKFKMFNTLINGGTEEVCETLINGVPYPDANNGAKIQAGLDIINTLSKHYDIYAPVFIDNRESVTEIPDMDCQVIDLIKDASFKELKIENN